MNWKPMIAGTAGLLCLAVSVVRAAEAAGPEDLSQRIARAPAHPRLFWATGGEAQVRARLAQNPRLQAAWEAVRITADHMLSEPPVDRTTQTAPSGVRVSGAG